MVILPRAIVLIVTTAYFLGLCIFLGLLLAFDDSLAFATANNSILIALA
jgi:hypothetical protein